MATRHKNKLKEINGKTYLIDWMTIDIDPLDKSKGKKKKFFYVQVTGNRVAKENTNEMQTKMDDFEEELKEKIYAFMNKKDKADTVKKRILEWLPMYKVVGDNVAQNTYNSYVSVIDNWIVPTIGDIQVSEVTADDIQKIKIKMVNKAGQTKKHVETLLNAFFNKLSVTDKIINPCLSIIKAKPKKPNPHPPSLKDYNYIMLAISDLLEQNQLAIKIGSETGFRASEICGITVDALVENKNLIRAHRKVVMVSEKGKRHIITSSTMKSNDSKRAVGITADLMAEIVAYKKGEKFNPYTDGFVYLLQYPDGTPLYPSNLSQCFSKLTKRLKEDGKITWRGGIHALRHSLGTALYRSGVPIDDISKRLGHSNSVITKAYYIEGQEEVEENDGLADRMKTIREEAQKKLEQQAMAKATCASIQLESLESSQAQANGYALAGRTETKILAVLLSPSTRYSVTDFTGNNDEI